MDTSKGVEGSNICTPSFVDSLTPNQPDKAKQSTLARKSFGITLHPAAGETLREPADVVRTLPKTLQAKVGQLLLRLSAVAWNERGELMHECVAIPGETENARSRRMAAVRQPKRATNIYTWNWSAASLGDGTYSRKVCGLRRNVNRPRK